MTKAQLEKGFKRALKIIMFDTELICPKKYSKQCPNQGIRKKTTCIDCWTKELCK